MTPLEDAMYMALMAARSFIQPKVRQDTRDMAVLSAVEGAIKQYQDHKSPPPGKVNPPMDWDAVKEIQPDG
jgi:hypothetical protein